MAPKHTLSSKRPTRVPKTTESTSFTKYKHFPFLELPQEIQDMIITLYYGSYSLIIRPRGARRPDNEPPRLACQQGLELVSKHVSKIATPIRKAAFDGQIFVYWSKISELDRLLWLTQCEDVEWLLMRTIRLSLEGVKYRAGDGYYNRIVWPFIVSTFPALEVTIVRCATTTVPYYPFGSTSWRNVMLGEYLRAFKDEGTQQVPRLRLPS